MKYTKPAMLALLLCLGGQSAYAGPNAEDIVTGEHPEFYTCNQDEDCSVTKGLCGEWRVVNTANEKVLTDSVNYLSMATNCKEYAAPKPKPHAGCSPDHTCQFAH